MNSVTSLCSGYKPEPANIFRQTFLLFFIFSFLNFPAFLYAVEILKDIKSSTTITNSPNQSQLYIGTGYFLPNEGDMEGAQAFALGYAYAFDKDTIFVDFIYSPTNPTIELPFLKGDVKNSLLQFGYMTNFGKWENGRLGFGMQIHQMDFRLVGSSFISPLVGSGFPTRTTNINAKKIKRSTFFGLGEYDISDNKTLRFQSSIGLRKNNIRFGGDVLMLLFKL